MDRARLVKHVAFQSPATYRIAVQGSVSGDWSERLGGMRLSVAGKNDPVTWLIGRLPDQTGLFGVLETLHELHLSLLSVEVMDAEAGTGDPGGLLR